jgi:hypothetical protein
VQAVTLDGSAVLPLHMPSIGMREGGQWYTVGSGLTLVEVGDTKTGADTLGDYEITVVSAECRVAARRGGSARGEEPPIAELPCGYGCGY